MNYRRQRFANLIKEELSKIIVKEIDFFGSFVTITDVEVGEKLEAAIVYFSVIPSKDFDKVEKILKKTSRHLQYLLMKKINVKPMPEIVFKPDHGQEKAAGVEKILLEDKIKEERAS
ncbi:MAG: ribosome-binding factor A [Patescibacteria group bacterium]